MMKRALLTVTQTEAPGAWFGPVLLGAALASPGLAQWSSLPPPATFGAATVVSGRAAFSSGTEVHLFDPATQTWQVTALPQVNGAVAAASAGGSALFTDGFLVDIYSPSGAG